MLKRYFQSGSDGRLIDGRYTWAGKGRRVNVDDLGGKSGKGEEGGKNMTRNGSGSKTLTIM